MPQGVKISKEIILKAAIEVLRKQGNEGLNARSIAREIGCSTQPIYSVFSSMEKLKEELFVEARKRHKQMVAQYWNMPPTNYKAYGMGYVRFAREEKELFRYLYLQEREGMSKQIDVNYDEIIQTLQKAYNLSEKTAKQFHDHMSIYSFGLAMLHNIGAIDLSDDEISGCFKIEFDALKKHFDSKLGE